MSFLKKKTPVVKEPEPQAAAFDVDGRPADKEKAELNRIAKMLIKRDFSLMEVKEKREAELVELKRTKEELEEAKAVLEIKVAERTKELQDLTKSLEEKVAERTRELQEKLEDLKRFNELVVDRELKMVELKEELRKCHEELAKDRS